ncbi:cell wall-binding repeat-containing protein [Agrococcus citreus]|uniref:SCP domain-containing protein n=1 Tax=Agrococcus citreus TaxID=84643 RepID=A0ABN1YYP9_9MICO
MRYALATVAMLGVIASTLLGPAPAAEAATARLDGDDRFQTSVLASQRLPAGRAVFLASGTAFPDALAAAPVAAAEGAHLLLVRPEGIPQVVADEIQRLAPSEVVLVGAEASLSAAVAQQAAAPGRTVTRIGGTDRVETSMLLLDRMRTMGSTVTDVWVASGNGFPDALAAGAVAAREGHALVLTQGASASFAQRIAARVAGVQRFHIPGSTTSVGADVEAVLAGTGRTVARFPGADRYETAVQINRAFTPAGSGGQLVLTSGADFPDGLVGAVYAGIRGEALYLTDPSCATSGSVAAEQRRVGTTGTMVLGGVSTVSPVAAELVPCAAVNASVDDLLERINAERALVGRQALAIDPCLSRMAGGWASAMAAGSLAGSAHNPSLTPEARACAVKGWGENVGRTVGTNPDTARMMTTWMNSEGHRLNIQRASFTHIGIGIDRGPNGSWYYVLDFGTR